MSAQPDIDRVLEAWLAEGPTELSDPAISGIVRQLELTNQRRHSLLPRRETMNRLIVAAGGVAAALVLAVVGIVYFYGPSSGPAGPGGPVFTSERHGYSVTLPSDRWSVVETPGEWRLGAFFTSGDPGVDHFEERGPDGGIVENELVYLSSQPIPEGITFDAWAAIHDGANQSQAACFQLQGELESTVVGGETARTGSYHCADFGDGEAWATVQTLVAHDGRGYAIYYFPATQGSAMPTLPELRATAAEWLARIAFTD